MTNIINATDSDAIEASRATFLPGDLVRIILEWLFDMHQSHRRTTQREILTLSKRVKSWLEPLLFRHISIAWEESTESTSKISRAFKEPRLAASIHTIFVQSLLSPSIAILLDVLRTGGSIRRLVLWDWADLKGITNTNISNGAKIYQTKVPSLRRLSIRIAHKSTEILTPEFPIFQSLTHLFIVLTGMFGASPDEEIAPLKSILHPIRSMENLTHLAFDIKNTWDSRDHIIDLIRSHLPSSTKTVILNLSDRSGVALSIDWLLNTCDPRLVFVLVDYPHWDEGKRRSGLFLDSRLIGELDWNENPPPLDMWKSADLALERRRKIQRYRLMYKAKGRDFDPASENGRTL